MMLIQNPLPPPGCAGAAPTFTMSDAPVYQPPVGVGLGHYKKKNNSEKALKINANNESFENQQRNSLTVNSTFLRQHHNQDLSEKSNSNKTNSTTNVSSQKPYEINPELMYLDIEKVKTTYFMNANRRLISPFLQSTFCNNQSLDDLSSKADSVSTPVADREPPIRISLNQSCCYPGDKVQGTVYCDLTGNIENIGSIYLPICENHLEEEVKLLVTFHGVERSSIILENGEIFCKERDIYRKTKEVGSFQNVVQKNMHEFNFSFDLPVNLFPSCNIHSCHFGKNAGLGTITYSVVVTLQGSVGIVSLQGNGLIIVKELPPGRRVPVIKDEDFGVVTRSPGNRNSAKILRYLPLPSNASTARNQIRQTITNRTTPKPNAHISLEKDVITSSGKIILNVHTGKIMNGLVKAKKLMVKLVRRIELHTDERHQHWEKTICEQTYDIRRRICINLAYYDSELEIPPSVDSNLIVNKYIVQVRARSAFGVLGGNSLFSLPVTIMSDESCGFLLTQCDGMCKRIKHVVHLQKDKLQMSAKSDSETSQSTKIARSDSANDDRSESRKVATEKLLFVKNQAEREIIETKLFAVELAKQQLQQAQNRALEAESELKETIKTISKE